MAWLASGYLPSLMSWRIPGSALYASGRSALSLRLAAPHGDFVELESLLLDAAEDHRAQAAVADGERFLPLGGGTVIPERPRAWVR